MNLMYIFYAAIGVLVAALYGDWAGVKVFAGLSALQLGITMFIGIMKDLKDEPK